VIANEFSDATGTLYPSALMELGLVLMLVTLTMNVLALLLVRRVSREVPV
jgi:phosphate transport system permease protein